MAHFRNGAISIVGHAVDHHRYTTGTVALIAELFEVFAFGSAGAARNGSFNSVLGHVVAERIIEGGAQPRVSQRVTAADPRRDGNFSDQAGKKLTAFGVLAAFTMTDIGPFTVSSHRRVLGIQFDQ